MRARRRAGTSGHEVQVGARLMQSVWASCGSLVLSAAAVWDGLRADMLMCGVLRRSHPGRGLCRALIPVLPCTATRRTRHRLVRNMRVSSLAQQS